MYDIEDLVRIEDFVEEVPSGDFVDDIHRQKKWGIVRYKYKYQVLTNFLRPSLNDLMVVFNPDNIPEDSVIELTPEVSERRVKEGIWFRTLFDFQITYFLHLKCVRDNTITHIVGIPYVRLQNSQNDAALFASHWLTAFSITNGLVITKNSIVGRRDPLFVVNANCNGIKSEVVGFAKVGRVLIEPKSFMEYLFPNGEDDLLNGEVTLTSYRSYSPRHKACVDLRNCVRQYVNENIGRLYNYNPFPYLFEEDKG